MFYLNTIGDDVWYRAVCIKTTGCTLKENNYTVYFLDWGMEYLVNAENIYKMTKEFVYLPATAYKCYVKGKSYCFSSLYIL